MCKFVNVRGIYVLEVVLINVEPILVVFEWETIFWKLVTVTTACYVDSEMVIVTWYYWMLLMNGGKFKKLYVISSRIDMVIVVCIYCIMLC